MKLQKKHLELLRSFVLILVGNVIYALTVKLFLLPANLISCGTTGIALVVNHLTGFSVSTFILIFNIVMFLVGLVVLGKQFALSTVISSLFYPLGLELLNRMLGDVVLTENMLLTVIFTGIGLGGALGIILRAGASTGGMDIPPLILKRFFNIPVSVSLYLFDFLIMLAQMFYHTAEDLLYGVLLLITISFVLNKVMLWGISKTEVQIISQKSEEIRSAILTSVDRGVTILYGEGGYLRQQEQIILSIISDRELIKVQKLVSTIDPEAFMTVSRVTEVFGQGFSTERKYK